MPRIRACVCGSCCRAPGTEHRSRRARLLPPCRGERRPRSFDEHLMSTFTSQNQEKSCWLVGRPSSDRPNRAPTELHANPIHAEPPKTRSRAKFSSHRLRRLKNINSRVTHAGCTHSQSTIPDLPVPRRASSEAPQAIFRIMSSQT